MSIRFSLLALLQDRPRYGYELRQEFEIRTGSAWPLNIGQVYTTLDRLQRDGLVDDVGVDADGRRRWSITDAGRAECDSWLRTPIEHVERGRDALAMKLAIASTVPDFDVASLIQTQREATTRTLQDLTRAKAATSDAQSPTEVAWLLVVDSMIFQAEAEVRWLDHSEQRLSRTAPDRVAPPVVEHAQKPSPAPVGKRVRR